MKNVTYFSFLLSLLFIISCSDEFGGKGAGDPYTVSLDLSENLGNAYNEGTVKDASRFTSGLNDYTELIPLKKGLIVAIPETEDFTLIYGIFKRGKQSEINNLLNTYTNAIGDLNANKLVVSLKLESGLKYRLIGLGFISDAVKASNIPFPNRLISTDEFSIAAGSAKITPNVSTNEIINRGDYNPDYSFENQSGYFAYYQGGKMDLVQLLYIKKEDIPDSIELYAVNSDGKAILLSSSDEEIVTTEIMEQSSSSESVTEITNEEPEFIKFYSVFKGIDDYRSDGELLILMVLCKEGVCFVNDLSNNSGFNQGKIYDMPDQITFTQIEENCPSSSSNSDPNVNVIKKCYSVNGLGNLNSFYSMDERKYDAKLYIYLDNDSCFEANISSSEESVLANCPAPSVVTLEYKYSSGDASSEDFLLFDNDSGEVKLEFQGENLRDIVAVNENYENVQFKFILHIIYLPFFDNNTNFDIYTNNLYGHKK